MELPVQFLDMSLIAKYFSGFLVIVLATLGLKVLESCTSLVFKTNPRQRISETLGNFWMWLLVFVFFIASLVQNKWIFMLVGDHVEISFQGYFVDSTSKAIVDTPENLASAIEIKQVGESCRGQDPEVGDKAYSLHIQEIPVETHSDVFTLLEDLTAQSTPEPSTGFLNSDETSGLSGATLHNFSPQEQAYIMFLVNLIFLGLLLKAVEFSFISEANKTAAAQASHNMWNCLKLGCSMAAVLVVLYWKRTDLTAEELLMFLQKASTLSIQEQAYILFVAFLFVAALSLKVLEFAIYSETGFSLGSRRHILFGCCFVILVLYSWDKTMKSKLVQLTTLVGELTIQEQAYLVIVSGLVLVAALLKAVEFMLFCEVSQSAKLTKIAIPGVVFYGCFSAILSFTEGPAAFTFTSPVGHLTIPEQAYLVFLTALGLLALFLKVFEFVFCPEFTRTLPTSSGFIIGCLSCIAASAVYSAAGVLEIHSYHWCSITGLSHLEQAYVIFMAGLCFAALLLKIVEAANTVTRGHCTATHPRVSEGRTERCGAPPVQSFPPDSRSSLIDPREAAPAPGGPPSLQTPHTRADLHGQGYLSPGAQDSPPRTPLAFQDTQAPDAVAVPLTLVDSSSAPSHALPTAEVPRSLPGDSGDTFDSPFASATEEETESTSSAPLAVEMDADMESFKFSGEYDRNLPNTLGLSLGSAGSGSPAPIEDVGETKVDSVSDCVFENGVGNAVENVVEAGQESVQELTPPLSTGTQAESVCTVILPKLEATKKDMAGVGGEGPVVTKDQINGFPFSGPKPASPVVKGTPPVGTPTVGTPPVETTPVGTTPVETTPPGIPPVETTPVETTPPRTIPVGSIPPGTPPPAIPSAGSPAANMPAAGTPSPSTPKSGLAAQSVEEEKDKAGVVPSPVPASFPAPTLQEDHNVRSLGEYEDAAIASPRPTSWCACFGFRSGSSSLKSTPKHSPAKAPAPSALPAHPQNSNERLDFLDEYKPPPADIDNPVPKPQAPPPRASSAAAQAQDARKSSPFATVLPFQPLKHAEKERVTRKLGSSGASDDSRQALSDSEEDTASRAGSKGEKWVARASSNGLSLSAKKAQSANSSVTGAQPSLEGGADSPLLVESLLQSAAPQGTATSSSSSAVAGGRSDVERRAEGTETVSANRMEGTRPGPHQMLSNAELEVRPSTKSVHLTPLTPEEIEHLNSQTLPANLADELQKATRSSWHSGSAERDPEIDRHRSTVSAKALEDHRISPSKNLLKAMGSKTLHVMKHPMRASREFMHWHHKEESAEHMGSPVNSKKRLDLDAISPVREETVRPAGAVYPRCDIPFDSESATVSNSWSADLPSSSFQVRGKTYLRDKKKVASEHPLYETVKIEAYRTNERVTNISHLFGESAPMVCGNIPTGLVMNVMIPDYPPKALLWSSNKDANNGEGISVVVCMKMTQETITALETGDSRPEYTLLKNFLRGDGDDDTGLEPDEFNPQLKRHKNKFRGQTKVICVVRGGAENLPWVVRRALNMGNGKPFTVNRTGILFSGVKSGVFEIGVDVHNFATAAVTGLSTCKAYFKDLIIDVCVLLEGTAVEELPERALACYRLCNPDFQNVIHHIDELLK